MSTILALDLRTATDWALLTTQGQIVSGTHSFNPDSSEAGGSCFAPLRGCAIDIQLGADTTGAMNSEELRHAT